MADSKRVTLATIAAETGVSVTTISKVLNGREDVAAATRARVEAQLQRRGYARRGATRSDFIEIVLHELDANGSLEIIEGARRVAAESGLTISLSVSGDRHAPSAEWITDVLRRRPAGVVLVSAGLPPAGRGKLAARGIPFVVLDPAGDPAADVPAVGAANWQGGLLATRHLTELGHRAIAAITGPEDVMASLARLDGYRSAMRSAHAAVDPAWIRHGDFGEESGELHERPARLFKSIIPAAQNALNISADPSDRAIAGIGRGGSQALELLLSAPGEFSKIGSFSGGLGRGVSAAQAAQINASTDLVRLYAGNVTDPAYNATVDAADVLDAAGVEFQSDGSDPATGGTWDTWQKNLHDFASRVFSSPADTGPSEGHRPLTAYTPPEAGATPTPVIDANGVVTFETGTQYASAKNVTVWANWGPAGNWLRIPMVKQADDRWRLTLGPLEGGSYYYKFIVDRVDRKDANNPTSTLSEVNWSTFFVSGQGVRGEFTADVAPESRGTVTAMSFTSTAGNTTRQANVYTPPGYDPDRAQPYPVLFLQHGSGQTWSDWVDVGRAAQILDNHLLRGTIAPMVVVMANGNSVNFQNELYQRLIPATEAQFNVSSQPGERAIAGLSAGSGLALTALYATPGQFAYVGGFSAFSNPPANADAAQINAGTRLVRIYSGDIQDFTYPNTITMISQLQSRGITHEFAPIIAGPHSWDVWQKALIDFLPRVFSNVRPVFATGGEALLASEGQPLSFGVSATDPDGDAITYSASDLPAGASFDPATQQFSWTPGFSQGGAYTVTFTAKDGSAPYSLAATKRVTITVGEVLQVSATAAVRCVAGKALVAVTVVNADTVAVDLALSSTYGAKSFIGIGAGKSATHSFTTRAASVPDGTVTVGVSASGGPGTGTATATYAAASCTQP